MDILEESTLDDLELIRQDLFKKKSIRLKTKMLYEQHNFNLFREANEGYAKLTNILFSG